MVRGSTDSDGEQERHDRFKSERTQNTQSSSLTSGFKHSKGRSPSNRHYRSDSEERRRRRSRGERRSRERKHCSDRKDRQKDDKRKDRSLSSSRLSHDRYHSRDKRSRSRQSDEKNIKHKDSKTNSRHHSKVSDKQDNTTKKLEKQDNSYDRFERRRPSCEDERVECTTVYWETTPSPDRETKPKTKKPNRDRKKSKLKKKRKNCEATDVPCDGELSDFGPALPPGLELRNDDVLAEISNKRKKSSDEKDVCKRKSRSSNPKSESVDKKKKSKKEVTNKLPSLVDTISEDNKSNEIQLIDNVNVLHEPKVSIEQNDTQTDQASSSTIFPVKNPDDINFYGPTLPANGNMINENTVLPDLSEGMEDVSSITDGGESSLEEGELVSPAKKKKIYGPTMPPRLDTTLPDDDQDLYGPALPPAYSSEAVDDVDEIGPLPEGTDGGQALRDLERRAAIIKAQLEIKDTSEDGNKKREEWMLELPEARRADLGLAPRKFKMKNGPDMTDRTIWSDTPAEKAKKQQLSAFGGEDVDKESSKHLAISERDKEMEKRAKHGKRHSKSLLEMHQKDMQKKKKESGECVKEERRPFNRDIDLQTNRFDEAQKKSIIKKAQLLNSRFATGESKFL